MNKLELIFEKSNGNMDKYAAGYFSYLTELLSKIDVKAVVKLVEELEDAYQRKNNIFIIGNGGSASTASHMANDIGLDVLKKSKCLPPFRVFALTDNVALMTAIANDDGYENLFINQLQIHYREGDKLIAISASGNSPNVVEAVKWVQARGGKTIGLVGFDGGKVRELCDIVIQVGTEKGEYGPVEDIHLVINHLVATWVQYKMKKSERND